MSSRPQSPSTNLQAPLAVEGPKESAVSRLLIAPLTFISFLLSLALIDSQNHSVRTHSHPPTAPPPPPPTLRSRIRACAHHCIYHRVPASASPYAYVSAPSPAPSRSPLANKLDTEPWHWHTKQRTMMKAEFSDAYRMRNAVLVVILAVALMVALGLVYGLVGLVRCVRGVWMGWDGGGMADVLTG